MLKKALITMSLAAVLVITLGMAAWFWIEREAQDHLAVSLTAVNPVKAGLLLGTSPLSRNGTTNLYFQHRIEAAAALFRAGRVQYLIVSGNRWNGGRAQGGYDEPAAMRDALLAAGVASDRIYTDYGGFRTLDSVMRANRVFGQDDAVVISQPFHIARAVYLARTHGLNFTGFAASDVTEFFGFRTMAREFLARLGVLFDVIIDRHARVEGPVIILGRDPTS